jgi:hypothetical protein
VALRGGGYHQAHASPREILETCFHPRMLLHYLAYIADVVPQGSFTFFTPTIVTGLGYTSIHAQLLTVPPWCVGFVVAITASYTADRFNARGWHITVLSTLGGVGWLTAGLLPADAYVARYGCLCLAATGAFPRGRAVPQEPTRGRWRCGGACSCDSLRVVICQARHALGIHPRRLRPPDDIGLV